MSPEQTRHFQQAARPAAFLDRDGTINVEVNYLRRVEDLALEPGAAAAVRRLNEAGLLVIVASNQSALARGMLSEEGLAEIERRMEALLAAEGARVDEWYYCPHLPDAAVEAFRKACDCRKPAPGMLLRAAEELGVDLGASVMIGDSERDVEAGRAVGAATVRVCHGRPPAQTAADFVADDLAGAVEWWLGRR
ncbi:MAG TPA: HAD family hydrolase [Candidatus Brocadiia bacterium]|nr:HAD family hydrolase [Candidatus Brocadiia bacterium]